MWATLAIATAVSLAPAQSGGLKLTNERATIGFLGGVRTDTKLLPGDVFFVAFDIVGLDVGKDGKVEYSMGMELKDSKGTTTFKQNPKPLETLNSLGGNSLPAFAAAEVGLDTKPGQYTLTVTVTDRRANKTVELKRSFDVVAAEFGLVRLSMSYDYEGKLPAPPTFVAGQSVWVNFMAVGFTRDKNGAPDLEVEMTVLDEKGQRVLPQPFKGEAGKDVPANFKLVPMQFVLALNRAGKFKIELKATDRLGKKTGKATLDLVVTEPK